MQTKVQEFPLVEISRGILAALVFLGHLPLAKSVLLEGGNFWPPPTELRWLNFWAAIGIDVFLFISGFLFSTKLDFQERSHTFLIRRIIRIYPALLSVTVILGLIFLREFASVVNLFAYLFFPVTLEENRQLILFGHLWSLRLELYLYLIIFFVKLFKKYRIELFFICSMIVALFNISFVFIIVGFFLGRSGIRLKSSLMGIFVFAVFIFYLIFGFHLLSFGVIGKIGRLFITSLIGVSLFSYRQRDVNNVLKEFSVKLGYWSYSAYLVNGFALYAGLTVLSMFHVESNFITDSFVLIFWILLSLFTYYTIEKNGTKIFNYNSK